MGCLVDWFVGSWYGVNSVVLSFLLFYVVFNFNCGWGSFCWFACFGDVWLRLLVCGCCLCFGF